MCIVHQWEQDQGVALWFGRHQGVAVALTLPLCYSSLLGADVNPVSSLISNWVETPFLFQPLTAPSTGTSFVNVNVFPTVCNWIYSVLSRSLIVLIFLFTVKVPFFGSYSLAQGFAQRAGRVYFISIFSFYLRVFGRHGEKSFFPSYTIDTPYIDTPVNIGGVHSSAESSVDLLC